MPVEIRTKSSGNPRAARTSAGIEACDMKQGRLINDEVFPKLTVILNSLACSTIMRLNSTLPVENERIDPVPVACLL